MSCDETVQPHTAEVRSREETGGILARLLPQVRFSNPAPAPGVARVRVAVALRPAEEEALRQALERYFQRPLQLEVVVDPNVLGGVQVRVGDTVIDGSLRGKLDALRRHLRVQSRVMLTQGEDFIQGEDDGDA